LPPIGKLTPSREVGVPSTTSADVHARLVLLNRDATPRRRDYGLKNGLNSGTASTSSRATIFPKNAEPFSPRCV
jgi:hypothetical protein